MRPIVFVCAVVCAAGLVLLQGCAASDARKPDEGSAPPAILTESPLAVLTGNDSHVKTRSYERIASAAKWKQTWLAHLGKSEDTIYRPAMEVDVSRCEVVAIFQGESSNSCGFRIDSVIEQDDSIILRFESISYQTVGEFERVTPFAFVLLPKSQKTITLQENFQGYGRPPKWEEVGRLGAAKDR